MHRRIVVVTGTDTSVGKTVVAALWVRHLRRLGLSVAGLKPVCSGGRGDAMRLRQAAGGVLSLEAVNPWHYAAPMAPLVAAREEAETLGLEAVVQHLRARADDFAVLVVEGAGGLLSPMGEGWDTRDLLLALKAVPVVVAVNRLGVINQVRLILEALPPHAARHAQIVLRAVRRPDRSAGTNPGLIAEILGSDRVHPFPWLAAPRFPRKGLLPPGVRRVLERLTEAVGLERSSLCSA